MVLVDQNLLGVQELQSILMVHLVLEAQAVQVVLEVPVGQVNLMVHDFHLVHSDLGVLVVLLAQKGLVNLPVQLNQ